MNPVILHTFPTAWPERSPDLNTSQNSSDFWLWYFFKDCVYKGHVTNDAHLKESVKTHVFLILIDLLCATADNAE